MTPAFHPLLDYATACRGKKEIGIFISIWHLTPFHLEDIFSETKMPLYQYIVTILRPGVVSCGCQKHVPHWHVVEKKDVNIVDYEMGAEFSCI